MERGAPVRVCLIGIYALIIQSPNWRVDKLVNLGENVRPDDGQLDGSKRALVFSRGKTVASKCFGGLRKVCLEVVSKKGAASRG